MVAAIDELGAIQERLAKEYTTVEFIRLKAEASGHEVIVTCTSGCDDSDMHSIARGMVRGISRQFVPPCEVFDGEADTFHVRIRRKSVVDPDALYSSRFSIKGADIDKLFPFHIAFDRALVVRQCGSKLFTLIPSLELGVALLDQFTLIGPPGWELTVETLLTQPDLVYMLHATHRDQPATNKVTLHGQVNPLPYCLCCCAPTLPG